MVEVVGIMPIVKILAMSFLIVLGSFWIGQLICSKTSSNPALQFFIGLSTWVSVLAIIVTRGYSVFTPSLLCILLLFKPSLKTLSYDIYRPLKNTAFFMLFFIPVLFIELYRQSYFSNEIVNSGFGDYQFYTSAARNIFKGGIESSLAYLNHYGISTYTNLYHYFDLYLLGPVFLLNIPPLVGYLFFFLPLIYSAAAYSIFYLSNAQGNRFVLIVAAFLALHIVGSEWTELSAFRRLSIVHYPKSCFVFFILLILKLKDKWPLGKILVGMSFLSLMFNPLIFILVSSTSAILFIAKKGRDRKAWKQLIQSPLLIIYFSFSLYFLVVFGEKSDNSVLYTFMENTNMKQYINGVVQRFIGYSGVIKKLPLVLFSVMLLGIHFYREKRIPLELVFVSIMFTIGHVVNSFMFNHYEGMQFFNISFVTFIALCFYYSIYFYRNYTLLGQKVLFACVLLIGLFSYTLSKGYAIFTQPRSEFYTSVSFNKELNLAVNDRPVNALFFKNYTEETHWIRTIPYLTYGVGYLNLNLDAECILPTHSDMFLQRTSVKQNAVNLISRAPFSQYCMEQGLNPTTFYDASFEKAIAGFIELHRINVLIFEKELPLPYWIDDLKVISIIDPQKEFDRHRIIVL